MEVAAYSFDEVGDIVVDYSGNNNNFNLTGTNGIRVVGGHTNGGLSKNGAIMPVLPLIGQTDNRTVMLWAKGIGHTWYIRWNVVSIDSGSWGILSIPPNVGIQARNASDFARPQVAVPVDGLSHHYCGTYDGTTVRFYLDGVEAASAALAGPLRVDANALEIMEWTDSNTQIDDLRIFNEALSPAEVIDYMNTPVTSSGGGIVALETISDEARAAMLTELVLTEPQLLSNIDLMRLVIADVGQALITVAPEWTTAKQYWDYLRMVRDA